jgi:hypothetical protein
VPAVGGQGQGTATIPGGLTPGDSLALTETSPNPTTRSIATLNVEQLRLNLTSTSTTGSCSPDSVLDAFGVMCTDAGSVPAVGPLDGSTLPTELDDLSGGDTSVDIPTTSTMIPDSDEVLGSFEAYADFLGPAVATATLSISPRGAITPTVSTTLALTTDAIGQFGKVAVNALASGQYAATWTITDANGDTRTQESAFVVQPGGAQGPTGPTGVWPRRACGSSRDCGSRRSGRSARPCRASRGPRPTGASRPGGRAGTGGIAPRHSRFLSSHNHARLTQAVRGLRPYIASLGVSRCNVSERCSPAPRTPLRRGRVACCKPYSATTSWCPPQVCSRNVHVDAEPFWRDWSVGCTGCHRHFLDCRLSDFRLAPTFR